MSTTGTRSAIAAPASSTSWTVAPASSAVVRRGVDDRPVGERVGERDAELHEVGAAVGVGLADRHRGRQVGEAAHQVGHQRGAPAVAGEGGRDAVGPDGGHAGARSIAASASARSLSPRPDRQITSTVSAVASSRPGPSAQATAWEDSSAGMIPSRRGDALEGGQRLGVGDAGVAGAAGVAQPGVLGTRAGVVEAGRDRVRLEDLAVLVLHDRRVGAVQDAAAAAERQRGAVAPGGDPVAGRLHADQLDSGVVRRTGRRRRSRSSRRRRRRPRGRAGGRSARAPGRGPRRRSPAAARGRSPGRARGRRRSRSRSACRRRSRPSRGSRPTRPP